MVNILKKADILRGIDDPEHIKIDSLGGYLWLRPLSNKELDDLDEMEAKAMGIFETKEIGKGNIRGETNTNGKLNVAKVTRASAEVQVEKVYLSLDNPKNEEDEKWDYEDINKLHRKTVEEIADKVDELSGVTVTQQEVERFR